MKLAISIFSLCFIVLISAQENYTSHTPTQTLRGIVLDEFLNTPIPNASVTLAENTSLTAFTDTNGTFSIAEVPLGRYTLLINKNEYEPAQIHEVLISSSKETYLEITLKENSKTEEIQEITVNAGIRKDQPINKMTLAGGRMFSPEEANRYAGGFDDPARLATAFAGVAGGVSSNGISVHGNAPHLLQWKLEGIEIPNPNHYADLSTVGGGTFFSISSFVLGNSDFFTGAFPAEYGNAISGIFDINLRKGNNQKYEHTAEIGITGINFASEGPLKRASGSSYIANYRHSIIKDLDFQDISFKLNFPTKKSGTYSLWGIGSIDKFKDDAEENKDKWETNDDRYTSDLNQYMGVIGIGHTYTFSDRSLWETSLGLTNSEYTTKQNALGYDMNYTPYMNLKSRTTHIIFSSSLTHKFSSKHINKTGITATALFYDLNFRVSPYEAAPLEILSNGNGSSNLISGFSSSSIQLGETITAVAGFNAQVFTLNGNWTLEPRASIKWKPDNRNNFAFAYGMHSRLEKMDVYYTKTSNTGNKLVNKNLDFTKAHHILLSYTRRLSNRMSLKIEPYFQYLYQVPVIADSSYSVLNRNLLYVEDALVNKGKGRNIGLDITLERYLKNGYYYMFSGSVFDSKYRGGDKKWHNTRFNRNYILNVLGGKEWMVGKNKQNVWGVNVKLTLQGGQRYSPIDEPTTMQHPDKEVQYDENRAFERQLPAMFLTNFTVKYRINRPKVSHEFSLKSINTTRDKEFLGYNYNYKKEKIEPKKDNISVLNISYKIEF